jgi:hypothetical protein
MARKFMYVCFGVLALMVSFHLGARSGDATLRLQTSDIAIDAGYIQHGQEIPLPYYEDGTQADEEDCAWMLAPVSAGEDETEFYAFECNDNLPPDRMVYYRWSMYGGEGMPVEGHYDGLARYIIIAIRGSGAWCAGVKRRDDQTRWGQIKADWQQ